MGVDGEDDGFIDDIFAGSTHLVSEEVDCLLHLGEIGKFLIWHFLKLSPGLDVLSGVVETEL